MNIFRSTLLFLALLFSNIFSQVGTYQIVAKDTVRDINISKIDSNGYFFKIEHLTSKDEPILLVEFDEDIFRAALKKNKIFSTSADSVELESNINRLWNKSMIKIEKDKLETIKTANAAIIAKLASQDSIGYVIVKKDNILVSCEKCTKCTQVCITKQFKPSTIDIAFKNGMINDIQTFGKIGEELVTFTNESPYQIRTKSNYNDLNKVDNYKLVNEHTDSCSRSISLSDLLYFRLDNIEGAARYIPKDTTLTIKYGSSLTYQLQRKSILSNLDMRLYTDITGFMSGEDNNNGRLQFELKYNLYTRVFGGKYWFEHISPFLNLTKISEGDNINVDISKNIDSSYIQFELLQNAYLFSGLDINLLHVTTKSVTWSVNLIGSLYRSTLSDTTLQETQIDSNKITVKENTNTKNINSWMWGLNAGVVVFESNNLNMNINVSYMHTGIFKSPKDKEFEIIDKSIWVWSFITGLNYYPDAYNNTTAIFIRSRFYYNHLSEDSNWNFEMGAYLPVTKFLSSFGL